MPRQSVAFCREQVFALALVLGAASGPAFSDDFTPKPPAKPVPVAGKRLLSQALKEPVTLQFNSVTLEEVVRTLRERYRITVNVDRNGQAAGIKPTQLVSCDLVGLRLQAALDRMLAGLDLDWVVVDDALLITTPARAATMFEIRFYNVSDLSGNPEPLAPPYGTYDVPLNGSPGGINWPSPSGSSSSRPVPVPNDESPTFSPADNSDRLSPQSNTPMRRLPRPQSEPVSQSVQKQSTSIPLTELIETSVAANWKEQPSFGRPIRQLNNQPNLLVIRQPQRVHREIEALLTRLRAEVKKIGGQASDELVTLAYPIGRGDDPITQLFKAAALSQLGNQNAETQQQILKIAERLPEGTTSDKVGEALMDLIEPESWKKNGGRGDLRALPGAILVRQTPDVHALIQRALATLSPGTGPYYGGMAPATLNESPMRVVHPSSN